MMLVKLIVCHAFIFHFYWAHWANIDYGNQWNDSDIPSISVAYRKNRSINNQPGQGLVWQVIASCSQGGVGMWNFYFLFFFIIYLQCYPPQAALRTCPATARTTDKWSSSLSLYALVQAEVRHQYSPPRNNRGLIFFVWTEALGDYNADGAQQFLPDTANYIPSCWWVGELNEKK